MSIRFKFRSSVAFDSVDLGGRQSLSVRDLRAKIVVQKKLQICQDFDLVISDAETGKAFEDDELEIKEGSSVVIKRVPAGRSAPCDLRNAGGNVAKKDGGYVEKVVLPPAVKVDMENFDDFGVDLYPTLQDDVVQRYSETSISRHQNIERSDLSEAMSKEVVGDNCSKEPDTVEIKRDSKIEVPKKLDEYVSMPSPTLNMDLPTELRCSLCNAIFKEAVMIPCCQHSFCDKCVRLVLTETARCPRCSSMKCTIKDLLPNLSLRQAIEHFLEAQVANNAPYHNVPQIAPDGESGIHVIEMSSAISIRQKGPPVPHSPSTTGKGSNQVIAETAYGSKRNTGSGSRLIHLEADKFGKSTLLPHKLKEMKGDENNSAEAFKHMTGFQGNNGSSKLPQDLLQEEAITTVQKKGLGVIVSDGNGILMQPSRYRKADRNCYMCGSPNHLIRDCPEASNPYPVNQTDAAFAGGMPAYPQAYWHGASFTHARPYANMYGAPGMMPFDQRMVPVSPFGISPYMPSIYPGMSVPYGFMRMGGVQPHMLTGAEQPYSRAAFMDPQDGERKHKSLDEHPERIREHDRDNTSEDFYYKGTRRVSHEQRKHLDEEATGSFLDDDHQQIHKKHRPDKHYGYSHDKHYAFSRHQPSVLSDEELHNDRRHEKGSNQAVSGRNQMTRRSERSNSEVQDLSDSSNRHSRERKKHHHEDCTKKQSERRGHHSSDLNRKGYHRSRIEMSDDEKIVKNDRKHGHRHHHHSESDAEPGSSSGRRQHYKEKESSQSSRPSKQVPKSKDDQLDYGRWEMRDGLDDDYIGDRHYHKRKRTR